MVHCMDIPHFAYPFIGWVFGFPFSGFNINGNVIVIIIVVIMVIMIVKL